MSPDTARLSQPLRIIHDHCTSTTLKEKVWCFCIWCQFYPRNMSGAPLCLKAPLMTGLEETARISRKHHLLEGPKSKISWRQSLIQTRWRRGRTRNDSHNVVMLHFRDPRLLYIYPHLPTDYNGFMVDFIHLWHIYLHLPLKNKNQPNVGKYTGWWQLKYFWNFHPENWGRWTHFDEHIFQRGWFNHQLDRDPCYFTYMYHRTIQINPFHVGKYAVRPMDPMGTLRIRLLKYSNSFISFVWSMFIPFILVEMFQTFDYFHSYFVNKNGWLK